MEEYSLRVIQNRLMGGSSAGINHLVGKTVMILERSKRLIPGQ
jgi:hypothetical protein